MSTKTPRTTVTSQGAPTGLRIMFLPYVDARRTGGEIAIKARLSTAGILQNNCLLVNKQLRPVSSQFFSGSGLRLSKSPHQDFVTNNHYNRTSMLTKDL